MLESLCDLCTHCPVLACPVHLFSGTWMMGPLSLPRRSVQHNVSLCVCSFHCRFRKLGFTGSQCNNKSYIKRDWRKKETGLRKDIELLDWNLYMFPVPASAFVPDPLPAGVLACSVLSCPVMLCSVLSCSVLFCHHEMGVSLATLELSVTMPARSNKGKRQISVRVKVASFVCVCIHRKPIKSVE
jgi:hypothetical protein